jgi:hypothetical protein
LIPLIGGIFSKKKGKGSASPWVAPRASTVRINIFSQLQE